YARVRLDFFEETGRTCVGGPQHRERSDADGRTISFARLPRRVDGAANADARSRRRAPRGNTEVGPATELLEKTIREVMPIGCDAARYRERELRVVRDVSRTPKESDDTAGHRWAAGIAEANQPARKALGREPQRVPNGEAKQRATAAIAKRFGCFMLWG